jgi:hypothetical protein
MHAFLARVRQLSNGLVYVDPVSTTDPGYGRPGGGWAPADPGYGRPGFGAGHPDAGLPWGPGHPDAGLPWAPGHPDAGLPGSGGHPGNALPVPPPEGVVTPPIYLPSRPQLPAGAGIVVPLPEGAGAPAPKDGTPADYKPFVLWYGPGTQSEVVYQPASTPAAAPK